MNKKQELTCNETGCLCGLTKTIESFKKEPSLLVSLKNQIKHEYKDAFTELEKLKKDKNLNKEGLLKMLHDPIESYKLLKIINPVKKKPNTSQEDSKNASKPESYDELNGTNKDTKSTQNSQIPLDQLQCCPSIEDKPTPPTPPTPPTKPDIDIKNTDNSAKMLDTSIVESIDAEEVEKTEETEETEDEVNVEDEDVDEDQDQDISSSSSILDVDNASPKTERAENLCTLCDTSVKNNPCVHPQLKVLICHKCEDQLFKIASKISESNISDHCSWCLFGGSLICCDSCSRSFCYECIIRNFNHHYLNELIFSSNKWDCFICCTKPIDFLIQKCADVIKQNLKKFEKNITKLLSSPGGKRKSTSTSYIKSKKAKQDLTHHHPNAANNKANNSEDDPLQSNTSESSSDSLIFLPFDTLSSDRSIQISDSSSDSSNVISGGESIPISCKILKKAPFSCSTSIKDKNNNEESSLVEAQKSDGDEKYEPLVLESCADGTTKAKVSSYIARHLKQHQVDGIRFLYDNMVTNIATWNRTPHEEAKGCILAHCMGLGKTLQIIAFLEALFNCANLKTVLVVCPLNTASNWKSEFHYWLKDSKIKVFALQDSSIHKNDRKSVLEKWYNNGGVLILSYALYRQYALKSESKPPLYQMTIKLCLISPGPDMVVCDEGHLLKNEKSRIFEALNSIKTHRRIILTGTPLQNNLSEYYSMVNYVRPGVLGSIKDFNARFKNPIQKGQVIDADDSEVRYMKKRCHVLHGLLKSFVQRKDFTALLPYLPPKYEYTIYVRSNDVQVNMYKRVIELARNNAISDTLINFDNLFAIFQTFILVGFHPAVFYINKSRKENNLLDDFDIAVDVELLTKGTPDNINTVISATKSDKMQSRSTSKNNGLSASSIIPLQWFTPYVNQLEDTYKIELSSKLMILNQIIAETVKEKQKLVIFSQSLACLDFISIYLSRGIFHQPNETDKAWILYNNYYRIDGSVNAQQRHNQVKRFNDVNNIKGILFLISTRAGGLGINLKAASRVVIMDCCWNPSNDIQSMFRVYRLGQDKAVFIYRLVSEGVLEERIYNRQITKLALSCRVVDKQQIERHFSKWEIDEIYTINPTIYSPTLPYTLNNVNKQKLIGLYETLKQCFPRFIVKYIEHNSLLIDQPGEELTLEEQNQAMDEYIVEASNGKSLLNKDTTMDSNTLNSNNTSNSSNNKNTANPIKASSLIYRDYSDNPDNYNIPILRLNINSDIK